MYLFIYSYTKAYVVHSKKAAQKTEKHKLVAWQQWTRLPECWALECNK